ncbi:hypothetical protein B0H21DRAFT_742149 [Amylocystis lapponica]|nr:hypothetical protein B0H21DRAFT_742149 [Amylocystis lapponica]
MRVVAVTVPVNEPTASPQITHAQLFEGLKFKTRDATRFASTVTACTILEEHPTGLLREIKFIDAPQPVRERIEFFPPSLVHADVFDLDGAPLGHITNLISTAPDGGLLLTFSFVLGPNGPLDTGTEAEEEVRRTSALTFESIQNILNAVRELVKSGEIP